MAGKLKGFDVKQLALKHGEKFLLAVVGLLVLFAISMGTKWVPFAHHPREITNAVEAAEHELSIKTWPRDERQQFVVEEEKKVQELVKVLKEPVDSSPFEFSQTFRFDIYGTKEPITDPELHPVGSLIAAAGRAPILVNPEPLYGDWFADDASMEDGAQSAESAPAEDSDIPPEFRSPTSGLTLPGAVSGRGQQLPGAGLSYEEQDYPQNAGRRGSAGRGSRTRGGRGGTPRARGAGGALDPSLLDLIGGGGTQGVGALMRGGLGFSSSMEEDEDFGPGGGYGYGGFGGGEARGVRFVAVRGVIPLRDQIKKYQKAANVTFLEAEQLYQIIDFELQRMKMREGADDPWGGEWETVDIEVSKEILRETPSFAPEPLEGVVHDAAITMPLPARAQGIWHDHATHPKMKDFELSEEEMQLETEFHEKLLERQQKYEESLPEEIVQKKGFSDLVHDTRTLRTSLRGGIGGAGQQFVGAPDPEDEDYDALSIGGGRFGAMRFGGYGVGGAFRQGIDPIKFVEELKKAETKDEKSQVLRKYVEKQLKERGAGGEMLLFRYLDFDVEPGATYKYRVRLEVTNPNYGRNSSEAAGLAHVVEGQTRKTEWSEITEPVRVLDDMDYFVDDIRVTRGTDRLVANWTLFQWDPEFGTTVAKRDIEVELGQEIGGPSKTYVLDPALPRFEIEDYVFQSGDVFVDAKQSELIDPNDHPDLNLAASSKRRDLRVSDQALVLRSDGTLKVIDQMSRTGALKGRAQYLVYEYQEFEDIKGIEAQQARADALAGPMTGEDYEEDFGGFALGGQMADDLQEAFRNVGRGRGSRNALRKGARGGAGRGGGEDR